MKIWKLHAYNVARGSCGEVRSLLYVAEDNYPGTAQVARDLRTVAVDAGSLVSGLISSTRRRLVGKASMSILLTMALGLAGLWLLR